MSVTLKNFRNLSDGTLDLNHPEVFLVGKNAQGKTNLLEAIYLLSYGGSFRTRSDKEIYKKEICNEETQKNKSEFYLVSGLYEENGIKHTISIYSNNKKKEIAKNSKKISDRKALVNTVPCILFCHDDMEFANGEMKKLRFFLDQTLTLYNAEYVEFLRKFNKILKTRNVVLKDRQVKLLDALDIQFAQAGLEIQSRRSELVFEINEIFTDFYSKISGVPNLKMVYRASWKVSTMDKVLAFLHKHRNRDLKFGTTTSGPQRDKIYYLQNGKPFIPRASTGQIRLISLVLRAVQAQCYFFKIKRKPVLLLDDVILELDMEKKIKFMNLLPAYEQMFCTFLPGTPLENYKKEKSKVYYVKEGGFFCE